MTTTSAPVRVVRNQRNMLIVATVLAALSVYLGWVFHYFAVAGFVAIGIGIGALNMLAIEFTMLRMVRSGRQLSKGQFGMSALGRIVVVSLVAIVLAVAFRPDGIGALLGVAVFEMLAIVLTTLPLLREVRKG